MASRSRRTRVSSTRNVPEDVEDEPQPVVHVEVLPNHEFLKFNSRTWSSGEKRDFKINRTAYLKKSIHASDYVSWGTLATINGRGENQPMGDVVMNNILRMEYHDSDGDLLFVSQAWARLFQIHEPIYREMVYEFMSTFLFAANSRDLETVGTIRFQLCGVPQSMSLVQFAVALGLYTEEEVNTQGFLEHLELGARTVSDLNELAPEWGLIGNETFTKSGVSDRFIRDPKHRLLHKMISNSITGRRESTERVTVPDLFYLDAIIKGHLVNVPYLLARYIKFNAPGRRAESSICGGQYAVQIARNLGLLTAENVAKCSLVIPGMRELIPPHLIRMGIVTRIEFSYHHGDLVWVSTLDETEAGEQPQRAEMGSSRRSRRMDDRLTTLEGEVHSFRGEFTEFAVESRRSESFMRGMMTDLFSNMHMDYTDYEGHRHSFAGQHRFFPQDQQPPPQYYPQYPPQYPPAYPPQYPSPYGPRFTDTSTSGPYRGESSQQDPYSDRYQSGGPRARYDDPPQ